MPSSPEVSRKRREESIARSLCPKCGEPLAPDKTLCQSHLDAANSIAKTYHQTPKGKVARRAWCRTAGRFSSVSTLARRQDKEWTLIEQEWREIISKPCFYCELENNVQSGSGLDRLDNDRGYVPGNIVSCCRECNTARNSNFSPEEMRIIGRAIREVKLARL